MQYQAILFDLDGTLLPMDQDLFLKAYFSALVKKLAPLGYDPKALTDAIWAGTGAMIHNDGQRTNEAAFWDCFARILGEQARREAPVLEAFYHNEFQQVRHVCGYTSAAKELLDALKAKGLRRILATNPLFPAIATESRIRWAGLEPSDFELYTTYENSRYCKPNPAYYRDILTAAGLSPEDEPNPIACALAVATLLRFSLGLTREAACVEAAVNNVLSAGWRTPDAARPGDPRVGAQAIVQLICEQISVAGELMGKAGIS